VFGYAGATAPKIKISLHSVWLTPTTVFLCGSQSKLSLNCNLWKAITHCFSCVFSSLSPPTLSHYFPNGPNYFPNGPYPPKIVHRTIANQCYHWSNSHFLPSPYCPFMRFLLSFHAFSPLFLSHHRHFPITRSITFPTIIYPPKIFPLRLQINVTICKHPRENICIYIYEMMTQFSLPISASAATQFSLAISASAATQFSLPISWSAATQFSLPISASATTQCLFKKKLINLRSWEGGVKPVLDRPKQG